MNKQEEAEIRVICREIAKEEIALALKSPEPEKEESKKGKPEKKDKK